MTPWLGRHYADGRREVDGCTRCMSGCRLATTTVSDVHRSPLTAWGVVIGFDAVVDGTNRLTLFVDVQSSTRDTSMSVLGSRTEYDYQAATFGIAYRR